MGNFTGAGLGTAIGAIAGPPGMLIGGVVDAVAEAVNDNGLPGVEIMTGDGGHNL